MGDDMSLGNARGSEQTMKPSIIQLCAFILLGLLLAAPGEVLNQILARHDVRAYRVTMTSYSVLLFVGFFAGKLIARIIKQQARAMMIYYLVFGSLGLAVEWLLLGNAPSVDPFQVITQPGMFTFWGTMLLGPRLIMEPAGSPALRRSFLGFFAAFSAIYLLVAALIPRNHGGIFFGFIIFAAGSTWLNYFYLKYFKLLKAIQPILQPPAAKDGEGLSRDTIPSNLDGDQHSRQ
jgi:hypothetical protein